MLLYEAKAPDVARLVFKASQNIRRFTHEREIDDLIQVETLYLSCDGNLLFAYGKQPGYVYNAEKEPQDPMKVEVDKWKYRRIPKRKKRGVKFAFNRAEPVPEDELQIETGSSEVGQIPFESWIEADNGHVGDNIEIDEKSTELSKLNDGDWTEHPKWATQPFGWDDSEVIDYSESEKEDDEKVEFLKFRLKLEDVSCAVQRDDGTFECCKCNDGRSFQHLSNVWRHSEQHREKSSICMICGQKLDWPNLQSHEKICRARHCVTQKFRKIKTRFRRVSDGPRFTCPECGKTKLRSEFEYLEHLNSSHSGDQLYICSCGKSRSRQYYNFVQHRRKYNCPLEGCSYPAYAERIIFKVSQVPKKRVKVQKEPKAKDLANSPEIRQRLRRRYPDGQYICEHCNKRCLNASVLALHRAKEHMERTIPCPEDSCDKMFANQTLLKQHVKSHLFLNKCDLCDMVFRVRMRHHMLIYHPKFHCKPCCFKSMGRARYENHLKSEKHKSRCGDDGTGQSTGTEQEQELADVEQSVETPSESKIQELYEKVLGGEDALS